MSPNGEWELCWRHSPTKAGGLRRREIRDAPRREIRDAPRREIRDAYTSRSIEVLQCTHSTVAVLDIRTIVWCSPQPGQTERSSKRCRQPPQR